MPLAPCFLPAEGEKLLLGRHGSSSPAVLLLYTPASHAVPVVGTRPALKLRHTDRIFRKCKT
eukprot:6460054-Amphidinium_carterae.1